MIISYRQLYKRRRWCGVTARVLAVYTVQIWADRTAMVVSDPEGHPRSI